MPWHQGKPYNTWIPFLRWTLDPIPDKGYPAGCVAIALSQIMTANEFPKKIGTVAVPWGSIRNVESYYSGEYKEGSIWEQSWAAWLVAQVGIDAKTKYGKKSSGSTWQKALKVLQKYGFRNVKKYESSANISSCTKSMIRDGKPVFYRGRTQRIGGSGHAWGVDGLWHIYNKANSKDKMELRHVNFGWGGLHNGWYQNGVFHPSMNMVSYNEAGYGDIYYKKGRHAGYKRSIKILRYDLP